MTHRQTGKQSNQGSSAASGQRPRVKPIPCTTTAGSLPGSVSTRKGILSSLHGMGNSRESPPRPPLPPKQDKPNLPFHPHPTRPHAPPSGPGSHLPAGFIGAPTWAISFPLLRLRPLVAVPARTNRPPGSRRGKRSQVLGGTFPDRAKNLIREVDFFFRIMCVWGLLVLLLCCINKRFSVQMCSTLRNM